MHIISFRYSLTFILPKLYRSLLLIADLLCGLSYALLDSDIHSSCLMLARMRPQIGLHRHLILGPSHKKGQSSEKKTVPMLQISYIDINY